MLQNSQQSTVRFGSFQGTQITIIIVVYVLYLLRIKIMFIHTTGWETEQFFNIS